MTNFRATESRGSPATACTVSLSGPETLSKTTPTAPATADEQNHLARGLALLKTGDARLSVEHPPVANVLSALPLLTLPDIRLPTDHPSWQEEEGWYQFAHQMMWVYNHDVSRMLFLVRLPIVFLTLALALVGYRFTLHLWGSLASLAAFPMLLFDPNIIAHGRYATTDMAGTAFVFLSAFFLYRLWTANERSLVWLVLSGIALGLAFGSKLASLVFVPIFALMSLLPLYGNRDHCNPSVHAAHPSSLSELFQRDFR